MRTFAQKPQPAQLNRLATTTIHGAVQRLLTAEPDGHETVSGATASGRFGQDLSRIPVRAGASGKRLAVNAPGDVYEQEADRISEQVMRRPEPQRKRADPTDQPDREHERLQTKRVQASETGQIAAPAIVLEALDAPGQPFDPATQGFMEQRFGYDFSNVRVHSDATSERSAREVNAHAYTVGHDIVFRAGRYAPGTLDGRRLIAHELAHVVQQGSAHHSGLGLTPFLQRQPAAPNPTVRERTVNRANVGERSRTVVRIEVVGHASPRWRGAKTPKIADELNWRLAETRARAVRVEVEQLLRNLLPNRKFVFEYHFKPSTDKPLAEPVKALDEPTDISLDFQGRGSTETLEEAGTRGRKANDDPMRRVEVKVTLHSQTETDVEEDVERSERKPGATTEWSIYVAGEAGVEAIGKASAILILLRNEKTGAVGTYAGWTSGGGASLGVNIAKTSPPDFESFTTPEPMTFADFSRSNFIITSFGAGIGAFGAEWSKFRFDNFGGGQPTPGGIQVGGLSFGGVEINLFSKVYGAMFLIDNPSEEYTEVTRTKRTQTYDSLAAEPTTHRVFFATAADKMTAWESDMLNEYLLSIVNRSGL